MCKSLLRVVLTAITLAALSSLLFAQQTGSVVGTVTDKTGAVVANASVTLTNGATKDIRHTTSNGEGFFAFSGAVAGDYTVTVEAAGFQQIEQSGIHLSPGDRRNLNVSLAVGAATEHITVEVNSSQIQIVDSGDLSSTLSSREIRNLTLQGRDVTELVKTLPGFNVNTSYNGLQNKTAYDTQITTIASAVGRGYTANGAVERAGGADLVSDGAHLLDAGCNCNATQTINADMVSEVKVTTSAYGADGVSGPVVISAVSKSGSAEYHGGAYLHFRDSALNSNDWNYKFNKLARPNDRYWYPGGQFSGPVPHTNKKLIFFAGYEYYNQTFPEGSTGGIIKAQVPTASMREGLFDPTLADNAALCSTLTNWPANQDRCQTIDSIHTMNGVVTGITNSDISAYIAPGAKALLNLIPAPNRTPTTAANYNFVKPLITDNIGYMFHTRVDYSLNDSTKLYVSFNQQHENYGNPMTRWWAPGDGLDYAGDPAQSPISRTISGNLVKVFNSTTTNEFLAGLAFLDSPISLRNQKAVSRDGSGYPYKTPGTTSIMPGFVNSWWNSDFGIPLLVDTGRADYVARKMQPSITDNFTKVMGTHTLKAGASWIRSGNRETNVDQGNGPNGTAVYGMIDDNNGPGGTQIHSARDTVANFLLDRVVGFGYIPTTLADMRGSGWGFYAQDEWKATKRLSLNFGMRFNHDSPFQDATGKYGSPAWTRAWYDADVANGVTSLPGLRWHAKDSSVPLAGHTLNAMFYAPRFGLAYDVHGNGNTMVRGGIGLYYYGDGLGGSPGVSIPLGGTLCSLKVGNAFLSQIDSDPATNMSCAGTTGGFTSATAADPSDHAEPRTLTYNFTISQQMPLKSVLEITYSGNQTSDLINPLKDINITPIGAFMGPDPNPKHTGTWNDSQNVPHPFYGQVVPINLINNDNSLKQDYKPFREYKQLSLIRHSAWANYNALQVSWTKQRGSFTYNLNYTWSKTLGIGPISDPVNIHNDYGILSQDRTHAFNASYTYEVGSRFKSKPGAIALNGWTISGITGLQSGAPLQQSYNSSNFNLQGSNAPSGNNTINPVYYLGTAAGDGGTEYKLMPQFTCDPSQPATPGGYINPGCFSLPTAPQFDSENRLIQLGGQGQYQWAYLRGPGYLSSDLSLARTVKVTERQNVQIKFTAINFLNHPLKSFDQNAPSNINLNYNSGVLKTHDTDWIYGVPNEKFGRRVLEMTLKYNF